ncbi:hypothetical protein PRIPAC_93809 [Pristionchus pacificus]|uniref:Uncharacterized protein n=1 Tax=Pristionchus pacificus TaxID=54126 RepID=A0A2A6CDC9_PRIPA|nr:hypothetical protein PRIPAC_93809 [Pristionchus pacificus]|eukprot:PDM76011.1 hypothetical protein PRIPAC_39615 [Pristionchus pacificus]
MDCCPALIQTLTSSEFPDGVMTFTYNSNACRSTVSLFCTSGDPAYNLDVAIVANRMEFLDFQRTSVTFPGKCIGGTWFMGTPPLAIATIECRLSNPSPNP